MPRSRDENLLKSELKKIDTEELNVWNDDKWIRKSGGANKRNVILEYIGAIYDDDTYKDFVAFVENDKKAAEEFDKLVDYPFTAKLIMDNIEVLRKAFVDKDKEALTEVYRQNEMHIDSVKYGHIYENDEDEEYIEYKNMPAIVNQARNKENNRLMVIEKHLNHLKGKAYNENVINVDTLSYSSPEITKNEFLAAAALIVNKKINIEDHNYSHNKCLAEKRRIDKEMNDLAKNPDFQGYVRQALAGGALAFDKEEFTKGFEEYKKKVAAARKTAVSDYSLMFGRFKTINEVYEVPPEAEKPIGPEDVEQYTDIEPITRTEVKSAADKLIHSINSRGKVFAQTDINEARDIVIANVFKSPNFDATMLMGYEGNENNLSVDDINRKVIEMRKELSADPIFQKLLARRISRAEFYNVYKMTVNREVNKKIDAEKKRAKDYKKNRSSYLSHKNYMKSTIIEIDEKTHNEIIEIVGEIKSINGVKKPSEYMKKLIDAYERFIEEFNENNGNISLENMDELNRAALAYYSERQGTIFSPFTDKGKARLSNVGKLVRVTEKIMDKQRKLEKKNNNMSRRSSVKTNINGMHK